MADYQKYISECAQLIEGRPDSDDARLAMDAPLLSVFLGKEAVAHSEQIKQQYNNNWRRAAEALEYLNQDDFTPDNAEDSINRMLMLRQTFRSNTIALEVVYWDLMDDNFENCFHQVKQNFFPAGGISDFYRFHFLFIRQGQRRQAALSQTRLAQVIDWAQASNAHLIVLSDVTDQGLLGDHMIGENYQIAADLMLLANSVLSQPGMQLTDTELSKQLRFTLQTGTVFSVGYIPLRKDTQSIAQVSLYNILDEYEYLSRAEDSSQASLSIREKLCNRGKYPDLFARCFDELFLPKLPKDPSFLQYLPCTPATLEFERNTRREQKPRGGVLSALFGGHSKPPVETNSNGEAIAQVYRSTPLHELTARKYYYEPVRRWFDSPEGQKEVQQYFFALLSQTLNYREMSGLRAECQQLAELAENAAWKMPPLPQDSSLATLLAAYMEQQLRQKYYTKLARCLIQVMEYLAPVAAQFDEVIRKVKQNLEPVLVSEELQDAYSNQIRNLCHERREELRQSIHPSQEKELLDQLEDFFRRISGHSIYHYTLVRHLAFMAGAAAGSADDVINAYFNQNMTQTCHLKLYDPPTPTADQLYCILNTNDGLQGLIDPQKQGRVFPVQRTDCIERLFLYPVDPQNILY